MEYFQKHFSTFGLCFKSCDTTKIFFFHFSGSLYNCQCHTTGKYSTSNVIATHFSQFDNKNDRDLDYIQHRLWNDHRSSHIDLRWCSFISRNFFTIGLNNRRWIIGRGKEKFETSCFSNIRKIWVWNYFYSLIEHFKQGAFCTKLIPRNFIKYLFVVT